MRRSASLFVGLFILAGCAAQPALHATQPSVSTPQQLAATSEPVVVAATQAEAPTDATPPAATPLRCEPTPYTEISALSDGDAAAFAGSAEDPKPEALTADAHYWVGNEFYLHGFYDHLKDLGGGYVGVGADQALLMVGWVKPQLVWMIDYDEQVLLVQRLHLLFIRHAKTPQQFALMWSKSKRDAAVDLIHKTWTKTHDRQRYTKVYDVAHENIVIRLSHLKRAMKSSNIPSYLSDQATYDTLRELVLAGRVRSLLVNLLDDQGLAGIAQASQTLAVPIRLLYFSNAEQYWDYPQSFRDALAAMNLDACSVVVRTESTHSKNQDYIYIIQPTLNFLAWLNAGTAQVNDIPRRALRQQEKPPIHFMISDLTP